MPSPEQDLIEKTQYLRNAAARQFDDFLTALNKYKEEAVKNLLLATDHLELAQGRAQQCTDLLRILEKIK